jgi:protein subunit release factor B
MAAIKTLSESELEEQFVRSSGPGGQNVNKVSTKVILRHLPTNLSVTVQEGRSQAANRRMARTRLLELLNRRQAEAERQIRARMEKVRRRSRPRPAGLKQFILDQKKRRAQVKSRRRSTSDD